LFVAAVLAAISIPMSQGAIQAMLLLASTLGVGIASAYELTARNKYCALLVERPDELGSYLTSFSVVFNVAKLVGPPIGGLLLATTGPFAALALDAASYLVPIATLLWLMAPTAAPSSAAKRASRPRWQRLGAYAAQAYAGCWSSAPWPVSSAFSTQAWPP
jgi:hypothetical protein